MPGLRRFDQALGYLGDLVGVRILMRGGLWGLVQELYGDTKWTYKVNFN